MFFPLLYLLLLCSSIILNAETPENECVETLEETVLFALETNPITGSKFMGYASSLAQINVAKSEFFPHVDGTYDFGPEMANNSTTRALFFGSTHFIRREGFLTIRQRIFDWGKTYWFWKQKQADSYTASADFYLSQEKLAYDSAEIYLRVIRNREILKVLKDNENVHRKMIDTIKKKVEGGLGRKSELELAKARYNSAKARRIRAEEDLFNAINTYQQIIGKCPTDNMTIPSEFDDICESLESLIELAVENNPAIAAKQSDIKSRLAQVRVSQSEYVPTVDFNVRLYRGDQIEGVPGKNILVNGLVTFNWEIFNGWRSTSEIQSNKALYRQAIFDFQETVREVARDVSTAYDFSVLDKDRYVEVRSYKKNIWDFFKAQEQEFTLSLISLFDLLNSQTEFYDAYIEEINSFFDLYLDRYRLLQSVGGLVNFIFHLAQCGDYISTKNLPFNHDYQTQKLLNKQEKSPKELESPSSDHPVPDEHKASEHSEEHAMMKNLPENVTLANIPLLADNKNIESLKEQEKSQQVVKTPPSTLISSATDDQDATPHTTHVPKLETQQNPPPSQDASTDKQTLLESLLVQEMFLIPLHPSARPSETSLNNQTLFDNSDEEMEMETYEIVERPQPANFFRQIIQQFKKRG